MIRPKSAVAVLMSFALNASAAEPIVQGGPTVLEDPQSPSPEVIEVKPSSRSLPAPKVGRSSALMESLSTEPTDFNFQNSDILAILKTFAVRFNKNIIAKPGVGGKVTLRLKNVPFDEAFYTLLDSMGLVAVQKSANVIEIMRATELPFVVEVFQLRYRFASELQATLYGMMQKERENKSLVITVDGASNALIVSSTNDVLQKIRAMLDQLDIEPPQIKIKARLIEMQVGGLLSTGVTWAVAGGDFRGVHDVNNFTPMVKTTSGPDPAELGVSKALEKFPTGGILEVSAILDRTQLYGILNLLKSDTTAKTVSEPTILTGNNKAAKIHVGQNLPVKTTQVTQTSTTQIIQYIPEGVDLDVTPIVSPGSNIISFKIKVGVSELVGFQSDNPITTERVAVTEVSVESGKTIVIGGLIKDKKLEVDSGIPILKHIPLLGWLFKNKRKSTEKTELVIFITPELVTSAPQAL